MDVLIVACLVLGMIIIAKAAIKKPSCVIDDPIFVKVREAILEVTKNAVPASAITLDAVLSEDLGLDSLDECCILIRLEQQLTIGFPGGETYTTVKDLCRVTAEAVEFAARPYGTLSKAQI